MVPMGPQEQGDEALDADYWRREAATWEKKAADLEDEIREMKRPYYLLFRELVHGEIVERSLYKMGEEKWPGAIARLPHIESWPSVVQGGLVFAVSPTECGVDAVKKVRRDS